VESGMHVLTSRTNAPVSKATQLCPLSLSLSLYTKFDKKDIVSGSLSFMQSILYTTNLKNNTFPIFSSINQIIMVVYIY
jgi:hypothetical protein